LSGKVFAGFFNLKKTSMKKITLLLIFNFLLSVTGINFSAAQTPVLYGTCYNGGSSNWGTIFQANLDGSNLHTVYSFENSEGAMPWGKTAQAPNGKIYGVTQFGGCSDSCTLYEYDPVTNTCIDVYDFWCTPPASEPSQDGLIILPDGNLYGLEQFRIIYKFNPNTHVYTLLHQATDGYYYGGLMQASDGALYGVSYDGGTNNMGYIFKYDLTAQTYTVIYNFDYTFGWGPYIVTLIQASDNKLYGTTRLGGANNFGVIFSYDLSSNTYTDLYDFDISYGVNPFSGLKQASDGKLYGTTISGGTYGYGVIYSYDIGDSQYAVVYNFDGPNGAHPFGGIYQASNDKLFGTTNVGGLDNLGTVFSYDIATNIFTKLVDFSIATGYHPQCDIMEVVLPLSSGINSNLVSQVSIYLDAASQHLIVQNSEFKDKARLVMYDATGRNVFQTEISNLKSEFDLSAFTKGIYLVQLKTNEGVVTKKIILTH
jgi:uncharacterized repeat protein (TIGR03803 family)